MRGNHTFFIQNLDKMAKFAYFMAKIISPSDVIALTGTLGAGKTSFTKLLCSAMGVHQNITSPTFTLLNEYEGINGLTIYHGDLYRLNIQEIEANIELLEEYLEQKHHVILLEWADRAPQLEYRWTWHLDFMFLPDNESARQITVECQDTEKLHQLAGKMQDEL